MASLPLTPGYQFVAPPGTYDLTALHETIKPFKQYNHQTIQYPASNIQHQPVFLSAVLKGF